MRQSETKGTVPFGAVNLTKGDGDKETVLFGVVKGNS